MCIYCIYYVRNMLDEYSINRFLQSNARSRSLPIYQIPHQMTPKMSIKRFPSRLLWCITRFIFQETAFKRKTLCALPVATLISPKCTNICWLWINAPKLIYTSRVNADFPAATALGNVINSGSEWRCLWDRIKQRGSKTSTQKQKTTIRNSV